MFSIRQNPPKDIQDIFQGYEILTQRLLYARGITTKEEAEIFLQKRWEDVDPFMYKEMQKGIDRILEAIKNNETIGIYSDYDCDGIPAAAALYSTFRAFNYDNVVYYVPNRNVDGFGLNEIGIKKMVDFGVRVVCILDCGTSDADNMEKFVNAQIDTIVLDHHLPGKKIPRSYAMINPTLEESVTEHYPCASGVTFLFIKALIYMANKIGVKNAPNYGWEKWQLDIVAMATMSDMVSLQGFNRQLVYYGLSVARKSPRPGLQALCAELKISQRFLTQEDFMFYIIPRINAASRMGNAESAFKLLTTDDIVEAREIARELTLLNNKRKTTVASMVRQAKKQALNKNKDNKVWVFGNRDWKPSLVGLVAQKMMDVYGKTLFVWGQGEDAKNTIKGSCRSKTHNTFDLMQKLPELFEEAGGHTMAGGFILVKGAEVLLEEELNKVCDKENREEVSCMVDDEIDIKEIDSVLDIGKVFSPFGQNNEQIVVALKDCLLEKIIKFGKSKEHTKYVFKRGYILVEGITFFDSIENKYKEGDAIQTIIGIIEFDTYKKKSRIRVMKII